MFTLGNMGVMICLGQGGLRSPSASSFLFVCLFLWDFFFVYLLGFFLGGRRGEVVVVVVVVVVAAAAALVVLGGCFLSDLLSPSLFLFPLRQPCKK